MIFNYYSNKINNRKKNIYLHKYPLFVRIPNSIYLIENLNTAERKQYLEIREYSAYL